MFPGGLSTLRTPADTDRTPLVRRDSLFCHAWEGSQ